MRNIYRVYDTHNGIMAWCLKKDLSDTINSSEGRLKVKRMDYIGLEPNKATIDDLEALNDYAFDNIEIEKLENEHELIDLLNTCCG